LLDAAGKEQFLLSFPTRRSSDLQGINFASELGCKLIIALDCGIKAIEKVEYAKEAGIDFVICDHHTPDLQLPNAVAVLDPKRSEDRKSTRLNSSHVKISYAVFCL